MGKEPKKRNADKEIKEGRKCARVWVQCVIITCYRWCDGYGKLKLLKLTLKTQPKGREVLNHPEQETVLNFYLWLKILKHMTPVVTHPKAVI